MFESGVPGACFSICLFVCPELRYQMAREQRAETSPQQRMVGRKHPWPTAEPRSFGRDWIFPLTSKCFCRKKRGCFSTFGRVSLPQSYRSGDGWQLGLTFWGLESGFKMFSSRSSQIIPDHPRSSHRIGAGCDHPLYPSPGVCRSSTTAKSHGMFNNVQHVGIPVICHCIFVRFEEWKDFFCYIP